MGIIDIECYVTLMLQNSNDKSVMMPMIRFLITIVRVKITARKSQKNNLYMIRDESSKDDESRKIVLIRV